MTISRVLMVSALVGFTGCSVAFQNAPPTIANRDQAASCSTSRVMPWVDAGFTAAEAIVGAGGIAIANGVGDVSNHDQVGVVVTGVALALAVVQLASAGNGFERAATCRAAKQSMTATAQR